MTKTLKQFIEGYLKVKSSDEQKFVDKHVAVQNPDRNGNGDDVFKGNTKTINRRKTRKGYDVGDDEKVYESVEHETKTHKIETDRMGHYTITHKPTNKSVYLQGDDAHDFEKDLSKAKTHKHVDNMASEYHHVMEASETKYNADSVNKAIASSSRRGKKIGGRESKMIHALLKGSEGYRARTTNEEADISEKAPTGAKYERMVKDIKKGYSKDGHLSAREKAIAYATAWKAKKANEEVEELDELSKDTLLSYALKAHSRGDMASRMSKSGADKSMANYANKRYQGVRTAIKKLANEEAEQIDELSRDLLMKYNDANEKDREEIAYRKLGMIRNNKMTPEQEKHDKKLTSRVQMGWLASKKTYPNVFKGKDAAKVPATRKEEVEQIDELSKKTLGSYQTKAIAGPMDDTVDTKRVARSKRASGIRLAGKKMYPELAKYNGGKAKVAATEETLVDILSGLKESHIRTMVEVYESLSEENQAKFVATCKKDGGIDAMLNFAIKNRGE
jgi:hypothetical protein